MAKKIIKEKNLENNFRNREHVLIENTEDDYLLELGYIKFTFNDFLLGGMVIFPPKRLLRNCRITDAQVLWCEKNIDKFDAKQKNMYCTNIRNLENNSFIN